MNKIYRFLISRQFAVWSLVVLAVLLIIGGTLPDVSTLSERELALLKDSRPILYWLGSNLQVQALTRSVIFLALPAAIWLSIALCTIRRLPAVLSRKDSHQPQASFEATSMIPVDRPLDAAEDTLRRVLRRRRWQIEEKKNNGTVHCLARKGIYGLWGSVVFHLSMLVFLVGIIVSILTRFDAEMLLTEGQTLALAEDNMLRVNRSGMLSPALPGTFITLSDFQSTFADDKYPVDFAAHVKVSEENAQAWDGTIRVNRPLEVDGRQVFLHRYGFAPRFEVRDEEGGLLFDYFVNLIIAEPDQEDHFDIPSHGLRFEARFFPDYQETGAEAVSRSPQPRNPVLRMRALQEGQLLAERDIGLGESAMFGGYQLTFADLRHWAWFGVVRDPGYGIILAGFALCILGLAARFLISEKWLRVRLDKHNGATHISMSGRSRYFPDLFEREIESIGRELQSKTGALLDARGNEG